MQSIRRQLGIQIGRDLGVRIMATIFRILANHLKIDFEALAIDLHLSEATQIAVLTLVSMHESLEVSLPLQALEQFFPKQVLTVRRRNHPQIIKINGRVTYPRENLP
jgi:hypothetical protein